MGKDILWDREGTIKHTHEPDLFSYSNCTIVEFPYGENYLLLESGHHFRDGQHVRVIVEPLEENHAEH
jgi:hypothetical protein